MADEFDLSRYAAAVFDLDGTVWLTDTPIPGAVELVTRCRELGLTVTFATNATALSATRLHEMLIACGLATGDDAVVTGGSVVADTLRELGVVEVVAEAPSDMQRAITEEGITVVTFVANGARSDDLPDGWDAPSPGRALVVGASRAATFGSVERIGYLASLGHPLYVTSLEPGFPARSGMEPGGGMLVAAARVLYDIQPIVLGKPSRYYADVVRRSVRTDGPIVMFGDSQRADIGIAEFLGADGVLLTTRPVAADLPQPRFVAASLADRIRAFERQDDL
jgi:HAD superfamily hydrolase (TIGR01450 family)